MIKIGKKTKNDYSDNPWAELGQTIFDKAVSDLANLRKEGVVVGFEVMKPWPKDKNGKPRIISDFNKIYQAEEVVDFFLKGWSARHLEAWSLELDAPRIIRALEAEGLSLQELTGDTK